MWRGDPAINAFVDEWVASRVYEAYAITLRAGGGQGPELVHQLVLERDVGARGSTDLIWINGETFHNLRHENLPARGVELPAWSRVIRNGDGAEYVFTQFRFPDMPQAAFDAQVSDLIEELDLLRKVLGRAASRV